MNPKYPVYVISKGRWDSRLTVKALQCRAIPFNVVVEPQEFDLYSQHISPKNILVLPFSNLGQGSISARNWVWEHSISEGHERHWILDDNIREFYRLNNNIKYRTTSGVTFRAIEDFVDRYSNIRLAGMQYEMFVPRKRKHPPIILNTRIYSCILIDNSTLHRWRGRYNEDTDLSLRCLKDGDCTVLFKAFLADKIATMTMKGGNTDQLYQGDGRLKMAESLKAQHPDVTRIEWKWGRWQHVVDYKRFKANRLVLKDDIIIPDGPNEYGMKLVKKGNDNDQKPDHPKRRRGRRPPVLDA